MKKPRVGINGFGRIGRSLFRLGCEHLDIRAINSRSSLEMSAHLLKYDSVHGVYPKPLSIHHKGKATAKNEQSFLNVEGQSTVYSSYSHPSDIPWDKWGVEWVLECSGVFKKEEDLRAHFKKGVKRVFVSAPAEGADFTVIYGVNHNDFDPQQHKVISNGSCTTNCIAPLVKILDEKYKIKELMFTTIHSYTQDQNLLDASHKKDLRRARAAGLSMIPTSTGAVKALGNVFSHLKGCIKGMAVRVPTANVSLIDMVCRLGQPVHTPEEINKVFVSAVENEQVLGRGVLACEEKPLVSVDFNGRKESAVLDLSSTLVIDKGLIKVLAWYDNEAGFSQRMLDFVQHYNT